jgi:hypothetical protein
MDDAGFIPVVTSEKNLAGVDQSASATTPAIAGLV